MTVVAHSPPPWRRCMAADGRCPCGLVWDATGEFVIAHVIRSDENHDKPLEYFLANVGLITEAPALLAVVRRAAVQHADLILRAEALALVDRLEGATP